MQNLLALKSTDLHGLSFPLIPKKSLNASKIHHWTTQVSQRATNSDEKIFFQITSFNVWTRSIFSIDRSTRHGISILLVFLQDREYIISVLLISPSTQGINKTWPPNEEVLPCTSINTNHCQINSPCLQYSDYGLCFLFTGRKDGIYMHAIIGKNSFKMLVFLFVNHWIEMLWGDANFHKHGILQCIFI